MERGIEDAIKARLAEAEYVIYQHYISLLDTACDKQNNPLMSTSHMVMDMKSVDMGLHVFFY